MWTARRSRGAGSLPYHDRDDRAVPHLPGRRRRTAGGARRGRGCCARRGSSRLDPGARRAADSRPGTAASSPTPAGSPGARCAPLADLDAVVVPSGSCAAMMRLHWPQLFERRPRRRPWLRTSHARVFELSQYLVDELRAVTRSGRRGDRTVAYHDSCHMLRELRLHDRRARCCGRSPTLRELPRGDRCCGFGGTFSVRYPEVSTAMADDKLATARGRRHRDCRQRRSRLRHAARRPGVAHRRARQRSCTWPPCWRRRCERLHRAVARRRWPIRCAHGERAPLRRAGARQPHRRRSSASTSRRCATEGERSAHEAIADLPAT